MDYTFWQSVASTSWWVYFIIAYFLWASHFATKPRILTLKSIIILPAIFTLPSLIFITLLMPASQLDGCLWLGNAVLGMGCGYLHYQMIPIKANAATKSLELPGSRFLFIAIILVLCAKLYFGFTLEITPQLLHNPVFAAAIYSGYGLLSGFFLGHAFSASHLLKYAKN